MASPTSHSDLFSPSSGARLIACPGSAKASKGIPEKISLFSSEGTDAHELASVRLLNSLGEKAEINTSDLTWYNKEMEDYIAGYVAYCNEKVAEAKEKTKDVVTMVEQQVSTDRYGEGLFGTCDFAVLADGDLTIVDLKYGMGVKIDATDNVQLKIYALCLIETFGHLYDINNIKLCIYQPRLSNVSEWSISKDDLYKWSDTILKDAIRKIKEGSEEFHPGKHCKFCKAKPICKALRDKNLDVAKKEFQPPFLLNDEEIEEILDQAEDITEWLNTVKDFALSEAIKGHKYKRYKLVEGRSNRKWTDEDEVAKVVKDAGFNPYEEKVLSVTSMQSLIGKKKFEELLNSYIFKPKGKLTLAKRDEDKRPEVTTAELDFKDLNEKGDNNNE